MFTSTETTYPMSMIHTSDFMVVLCNQLQACPSIKKLSDKNSLTLFNLLTPNYIISIDNEISANPYILSEAMSLLELASQLGTFYSYDFVGCMKETVVDARAVWMSDDNKEYRGKVNPDEGACTQQELMQDYFINSAKDMDYFLRNNPVYLGIYIYVYLSAVSME